jgi:G3E family GTPase
MFAGAASSSRTIVAQGFDALMTRVHIITGSFGAGKTTAIRWLMHNKPAAEMWVVILNEFTDAGLDALQVAQSAQGSFDVRLVAGGCLCCVGELEFGKQLRDILRNLKPVRLLIEPSGAGHAADIVDILSIYERQGVLNLDSVTCLIDPIDAQPIFYGRPANEWSQIQSADVLLLSKPDLADGAQRTAFDDIAAAQFPAKRYLGTCSNGALPEEALQRYERGAVFSLTGDRSPVASAMTPFDIGDLKGMEAQSQQLGLWAVQWQLPSELTFARTVLEPQMRWQVEAYQGFLRRMKGVFRTGPGPSWLVQGTAHGLIAEDSAYRRDSRLELVLSAEPTHEFLDGWRALLRDAANPRRVN